MESVVKLSVLAWTLAAVLSAGVDRERRFLMDIKDGANDHKFPKDYRPVFSWDIDDNKFPVKNKHAVSVALSDAHYEALELSTKISFLDKIARFYRLYSLSDLGDKRLEKWKVAAEALTALYDATDTATDLTYHYVSEISNAINNNTDHQADLFDRALRNMAVAIDRLECRMDDATHALMEMPGLYKDYEADGIYGILSVLMDLSTTTINLKESFTRLIDAAGIASDG